MCIGKKVVGNWGKGGGGSGWRGVLHSVETEKGGRGGIEKLFTYWEVSVFHSMEPGGRVRGVRVLLTATVRRLDEFQLTNLLMTPSNGR